MFEFSDELNTMSRENVDKRDVQLNLVFLGDILGYSVALNSKGDFERVI